jgi:hypothetical protein
VSDWKFQRDFTWQERFIPHFIQIAATLRVRSASVEDDRKRNTDLLILRTDNDWRIACRARRLKYANHYGHQITVRLDRPSGALSEMQKMHEGFGDFGIYGFEAHENAATLSPWVLYNLALLREYLDNEGQWYEFENPDQSSHFAVFDLSALAAVPGLIHNSKGHSIHIDHPAAGRCRLCGRPAWATDEHGPMHPCCVVWSRDAPGEDCPACRASIGLLHKRWGWP